MADLDGDGRLDLLSGSWPGEIYLFRGGPERTFAAPEMLKDEDGRCINVGAGVSMQPGGQILVTGHFEEETTDEGRFLVVRGKRTRIGADDEVWSTGSASAVHAADWDGDGDLDLLVGEIGGRVSLVPNRGTRTEPSFGREMGLTCAVVVPVKVEGDAGPFVADWDGDGDLDLLVGAGDGSVSLFRNVGKAQGMPVLALPETLVPPGQVTYGPGAPAEPRRGCRAKVCATDWNGDGRLDLLVGDFATQKPDLPEPTAEEKAEQERIRGELQELQEAYGRLSQKLWDGSAPPPGSEEREKLNGDLAAAGERLQALRAKLPPEYENHGWVWLFLRAPAEG